MSQKVRKTLIMIVMAALIICLMAASLTYTFTYGRYAGGKFDEEKSPYDDLIEFVGAREYTVRSPEELIQAIKDGYSNIVIAEDAEEPFVITEGVTDVTANLVLNLNGKVVVRNSRNPMLDVQTNVSVVLVYDSKQTGAFYNPVGSSLMASGGSLTVGSGGYESGPRAEEYQGKEAAGELSPLSSDVDVAIFTRGGITSPNAVDRANPNQLFYQQIEVSSYPVPKTTGRYYRETAGSGYDFVPADTFLVYTVEENCFIGDDTSSGDVEFESGKLYVDAESEKVGNDTIITASEFTTPLCNVASCDFYYYYPISGTAGTAESPQDYAVIYGYWDVMKLARDDGGAATALKDSGLIHPYGAVRMVEGEGIVRGGTFSNHFDAVNTYGIYAEGGTLSVSKNTTVDTTFTTGGEGVCIRVQSAEAEDKTTGGSLTISGGEFSSEIGNTIEMSGGKMTVTAGTFTKSAARSDGNDQIANQTAIIDIQGGTLTIKGNSADSVKLTAGSAVTNPDDGTVTYSGTLQNVFGIRAEGGTVTTSGCTFNISGDYSAGVLSYNGTINLDDNTVINVTQSETATVLTSAGVSSEQASEGGEHPVKLSGDVTITSNGLGITARGVVNVTDGNSTVTTSRGTGIYVNNGSFTVDSRAEITVKSTVQSGCSWATPPGTETTNSPDINIYNGVYVQGGSLVSTGTLNVTFTGVQNESKYNINTYGITLPTIGEDGIGSTTQRFWNDDNSNWKSFYNAYKNLSTPSFQEVQQAVSYAVRVEGSGDTTVSIAAGNITNSVGGGVYVGGGTVDLGTSANNLEIHAEGNRTIDKTYIYTFTRKTGREYHDWIIRDYYEYTIEVRSAMYFAEIDNPAQNWAYRENQTGGDAVRVEGGTLTIKGGNYTSAQGNGIVAVGGTTTINGGTFNGSDNYKVADSSGLVVPAGPAASYAFKVYGGEITVNAGRFGDPDSTSGASGGFVMGTSADAPGTAYINGGTFAVSKGNTGGQAGFGVYRYANVTFGQEGTTGDIQVTGLAAGLVLERTQGDSGTTVTINRGAFSSTRTESGSSDGVWYGNGTSKLNITGGTFTGAVRSGLYFEVNQWNDVEGKGNAFITGGMFIGNSSSQGRYWINGAIGAPSSGIDEGVGYSIQIQDFIDCSSGKYIDYYSDANGTSPDRSVELSTYIGTDRGDQKINQTTCRYNKVIIR